MKLLLAAMVVTATVYNAVPEQCNSDYLTTASMKTVINPAKHRWIAVSRDLESAGFVFGTKVIVECCCEYDGVWTVEDRMNKRWTKRIDFLVEDHIKLGKWDSVRITKYNGL